MGMERIEDAARSLAWLSGRPDDEAVTGYEAAGWESSTWVLHAMYHDIGLAALGSHDDLHRRRLDAGVIAPTIINGVDLEEETILTGTPLGFVGPPGMPWRRVRWSDYLADVPGHTPDRSFPAERPLVSTRQLAGRRPAAT